VVDETKSGARVEKELVLIGGGHAHVQVLRRWMMDPLPGVRLTLVSDRLESVYSGMVPGAVAGDYEPGEMTIDLLPLARRAGARCIRAGVTAIDSTSQVLELEGRPPMAYDVASLDVGSTVRGGDVPGALEHAVATRPIADFIPRLEAYLAADAESGKTTPLRVAVVGTGPAGVELALCLEARLRARRRSAEIVLLGANQEILPGGHRTLAPAVERELKTRGIAFLRSSQVLEIRSDELVIADETQGARNLPQDLTLWATGPAPHGFPAESGLPCTDEGYIRVASTLEVEGCKGLFAVGDCAQLAEYPWVPRAGVYAVRAGPYLDGNLRARLSGTKLRAYRPQRDFLALLNLGEGRAIGGKWGLAFSGGWVWRLKDWIDRGFMRKFQVLDAQGSPNPAFQGGAMGSGSADEEMECGGCAAKVGPSPLHDALGRLPAAPADSSVLLGMDAADDAAAFRSPGGDILLATVDAFRAFADDPWLVGRVAAVNAVSDLLAKGATPRHALALVTVPRGSARQQAEDLYQVLSGVRAALDPMGISLVGGHSTSGPELFVGLSVTGDANGEILGLTGLEYGDHLILTKPLGTGILLAADGQGLAPSAWLEATTQSMLRDNLSASGLARKFGATACTDISGFGLIGHLGEMLSASGAGAVLSPQTIPLLPGALELARRGIRSTFHDQNAQASVLSRDSGPEDADYEALLVDPQTSGGLLIGSAPDRAEDLVSALRASGDGSAGVIGRVVELASGGTPGDSQARVCLGLAGI
jgi:selenide, water dikinase